MTGIFASVFSIFGSSLICLSVGHKGKREIRENTLYQLLLGLSISDILSTTAMLLGPFSVPEDPATATLWAIGNQATCSVTAFMIITFVAASTFYNFFISVHFWRIVRNQEKQKRNASADRNFQISAHCCSLLPSILLGSVGLVVGGYGPHEFLTICYTSTASGKMISRVRMFLSVSATLASAYFTASLVRTVRARFRRSDRYLKRAMSQGLVTGTGTPEVGESRAFDWRNSMKAFRSSMHLGKSCTHLGRRNMDVAGSSTEIASSSQLAAEGPTLPDGQDFEPSTHSVSENPTGGGSAPLSGLRRNGSHGSGTNQRKERSQQREVATQAVWYMLAYLNSSLVPTVALIIMNVTDAYKNEGTPQYFFLLWCLCFFTPIQGALNFIVYIRPRYNGWQAHLEREQQDRQSQSNSLTDSGGKIENKKASMYHILKMAVLKDVPRKMRRQSIAISTNAGESMRQVEVSFARDIVTSTTPVGAEGTTIAHPIFHSTPPMASLSSSSAAENQTSFGSIDSNDHSREEEVEIAGMEESEVSHETESDIV